jgi:DegV family protein with EDD domain
MIRIATDVTADLPADELEQHNIHLIPAWVQTKSGKVRTDQVERAELLELLNETQPEIPGGPRTIPLDEEDYHTRFHELLGKDDTLLFISTSRRITRVFDIVSQTAQRDSGTFTVFDSGGFSLYQGLVALCAARLAQKQPEISLLIEQLEQVRKQIHFYIEVNSLAHLHRGGRVNLAQYMIGNIFDIKPILTIKDGDAAPVENIRGRERALIRMQLYLLEAMKTVPNICMGVVHVDDPNLAERAAGLMRTTLRPAHSFVTLAGPTVTVHGGPGAVGIAVCPMV